MILLSGPPDLPQLDPLATVDEQARPPALPQDPDDEADPQGAPRHLRLQVAAVQGPGHGGCGQHQDQGCLQSRQVAHHLQSSLTKISYFGNSNLKFPKVSLSTQFRGLKLTFKVHTSALLSNDPNRNPVANDYGE